MESGIIEDLIDSLDSTDDNDWTERGIVKLVAMTKFYRSQVNEIETFIERIRGRIAMFTLIGALFSMFGTAGIAVSLANDIINIFNSYENIIYWRIGVMVVSFSFNMLATLLIAYLKVKSYDEQLQSAVNISAGYLNLSNTINSELYKKARNRGSMTELLKKVMFEHEQLQKVQLMQLNMNSRALYVEMDDVEKRMSTGEPKKEIDENYHTCE